MTNIPKADNTTLDPKEDLINTLTIDEIVDELGEYWLSPEKDAIRTVLATTLAFRLNSDPLWLFLIAPPSSLKTEIINGLRGVNDVYPLSSLTSQTLSSGLKEKSKNGKTKNHSLLTKIGSKILLFKDFGTVLSGRWDELNVILAQLREVYDGEFVKEYGTGVRVDWSGKMGFIAGATQIIDKHSTVTAILGERFIQYRMKGVNEVQVSMQSMSNMGKEDNIRKRVQELFAEFLNNVDVPSDPDDIILSSKYQLRLANLCSFVVKARSGTIRDGYRKELEYIPDPEAPARLAKQLAILAKCLALVDGENKVTLKQYATCIKVAFDCVPRQRLMTLNALFDEAALAGISTPAVSEKINYSTNATKIFLEDLNAFGIVDVEKGGQGHAHIWKVSKKTKKYLRKALVELPKPPKKVASIYGWWVTDHQNSNDGSTDPLEAENQKNNKDNTSKSSFSDRSKKEDVVTLAEKVFETEAT